MKLVRAWLSLVWLSFKRLLWSSNTWLAVLPLVGCLLFLAKRRYGVGGFTEQSFDRFSDHFLIRRFFGIILPLGALAFSSGSIGGDREDRTLLFLLVRPVPRWLILLAKYCATLPLALGVTIGGFYLCCLLTGDVGEVAFHAYLPAVFYTSLAYCGLFHLFAVTFRHSTILALVYALLVENLLSHVPGIVKRVAINYYGRTLLFAAGEPDGLHTPNPHWFEPFSPWAAQGALVAFAIGGLLLALVIFQRREYRDLV